MNTEILITAIRTPAAATLGYQYLIGRVLQIKGNAYNGFYVVLPDGSEAIAVHFNYEYV